MHETGKKTILVIDDDITILTIIRKILENSFDVCLAKSADIAKTILQTTEVDLILLDIMMPEISGFEFMEYINNNNAYYLIPVIFITSNGRSDFVVQAKNLGAKDFIVKPIAPKVLLTKIYTTIKAAPRRINRDVLIRKVSLLRDLCQQGKSVRIEEIVAEFETIHYDMTIDKILVDVCKSASCLDYLVALEKIQVLERALANADK